ncbi:hypothetical protein AB7W97_11430 [Providencia rettgeri]|uniref:hypothetical protein n=1 Tax=unclassified Providencia TaxID=2633465 RepID=UPI00234A63B6|nr:MULTISPECIES: hypothetical protein [unclassified Providencia]
MSADITIHQAAVKAQQVEMINLLIESYPHKMQDSEITALATLMAGLAGDVSLFLINEIEKRAKS